MNVNVTFDQALNSLPAAFVAGVNNALQYLDGLFTNPITLNLHVGYGEVHGLALDAGTLGSSYYFLDQVTYSQVRGALSSHATSADDAAAVNSLPSSDPTNGGHFWTTQVEALALGILAANAVVDGFVGFSNTAGFDYDRTDGIAAGQYDFLGTLLHEVTEVMGRGLLVGGLIGSTANSYGPLDLFHFSGPGVRIFTGTSPGYFSLDGGITNLDNFNTNPGGDFGDWAASAGHDSFLAFSSPGVANLLTENDLREMDILGYTRAGPVSAPVPSVSLLDGVDLNGDHTSDVLWRNANGDTGIWEMSNGHLQTGIDLGIIPTSSHLSATGDFNGDGVSDILWRSDTGNTGIWEMSNGHLQTGMDLGLIPTSSHIVATGDFNGDHTGDILWRSDNGDAGIWEMSNGHLQTGVDLGIVPTSSRVAGTGDFDGDHTSDILWRSGDGDTGIWEMSNGHLKAGIDLGLVPTSCHIAGTGDFNGDGTSDILWRSDDGATGIWEMSNGRLGAGVDLGIVPISWHVVGTGDYNGDGTSDILWRNDNGDTGIWHISNGHLQTGVDLGVVDTSWTIAPDHFLI